MMTLVMYEPYTCKRGRKHRLKIVGRHQLLSTKPRSRLFLRCPTCGTVGYWAEENEPS